MRRSSRIAAALALFLALPTSPRAADAVRVLFEVGQLSVGRVGGTGKFWGTLSIVRTDGSLSVSVGASP